MTDITLRDSLAFVELTVTFRGKTVTLSDVLLDTGSGSTVLAADAVDAIGLRGELKDVIRAIHGVGGSEFVIEKPADALTLDGVTVTDFPVEVGGLDYGFVINGIVGLDLLRAVRATIDLDALELRAK